MYVQSCCFANKTTHSELFFDVHNGSLKSLVTTSYSATISTWASFCASQQTRPVMGHVHYKGVWVGEFASQSTTTTFVEISGCSWLRLKFAAYNIFNMVQVNTLNMSATNASFLYELWKWSRHLGNEVRNMISKRTCLNLEPTWKRNETKWESEIQFGRTIDSSHLCHSTGNLQGKKCTKVDYILISNLWFSLRTAPSRWPEEKIAVSIFFMSSDWFLSWSKASTRLSRNFRCSRVCW